jgi:NTE family protein
MIGALSAVQSAYDWDPRDAEVIVGTSAGSVLAAALGVGFDVGQLVRHQQGAPAPEDPRVDFDVDTAGGDALPPRPKLGIGSAALLARIARRPRNYPPLAALAALAPHGQASAASIRGLIEAVVPGGSWVSRAGVWIVAMDYDRGRRVAFGRDDAPGVPIADAVAASCAIPGWFPAVVIDGRRYVDGGAASPASLDLVAGLGLDEVICLAPMASFWYDKPRSVPARLERRARRAFTNRTSREADKVRRGGTAVTMLGPGPADLEAIGVNLMDPSRRSAVLATSLRTSAAALAVEDPAAGEQRAAG